LTRCTFDAILAGDLFVQPHNFTPPGLTVVLRAFATLVQQLMDHLMQQIAFVGDQQPTFIRHANCN
jgi:hypothetical protein